MIKQEKQIIQGLDDHLFEAPVPGQSLTNSPDEPYPWEKPPVITSQRDAINRIFLDVIKPDNMETLARLMMNQVPIANISELLLKTAFQKGFINPDLAISLMEPVMYMLLTIAEKVGIDPVLADDDMEEENLEMLRDPQESAIKNIKMAEESNNPINIPRPKRLREVQAQPRNIPLSNPDLKKQLDNLDTSKVRASILQKTSNNRESLLGKEEI
tara:strand:+ start:359 stop:1000 length:642 start_codon:yes stop_codon:yes gene_type:complete